MRSNLSYRARESDGFGPTADFLWRRRNDRFVATPTPVPKGGVNRPYQASGSHCYKYCAAPRIRPGRRAPLDPMPCPQPERDENREGRKRAEKRAENRGRNKCERSRLVGFPFDSRALVGGGGGWIRTSVGLPRRIYSPIAPFDFVGKNGRKSAASRRQSPAASRPGMCPRRTFLCD